MSAGSSVGSFSFTPEHLPVSDQLGKACRANGGRRRLARGACKRYLWGMTDETLPPLTGDAPAPRVLPPAALRALAEAEERRRLEAIRLARAEEGGPSGPEPTRYGDWERKGLAVDF